MDLKKQVSLAASIMGKLSTEKDKRTPEFFRKMQEKSVISRAKNKKRVQEEQSTEKA